MLGNLEEVKKAKAQIIEGSLTLWNTRLEALQKTGNIKDLLQHLGSPVEWSDNCGCNVQCGSLQGSLDQEVVNPVVKKRL